MDKNEAIQDFMKRVEHYARNYEKLDYNHDRNMSFIQIFNQGERFLVNKLAGKTSSRFCIYLVIHLVILNYPKVRF